MRINAINPACKTPHFKAPGNLEKTAEESRSYDLIDKKKLLAASSAVAAIGIAAIAIYAARTSGFKPSDAIKKLKTKLNKKPDIDPVEKILKGKRDAEALNKYKKYRAQQKIDSLNRRLSNGEFNNKPQRVFTALRKNEIKLARITGNVSNYIQK